MIHTATRLQEEFSGDTVALLQCFAFVVQQGHYTGIDDVEYCNALAIYSGLRMMESGPSNGQYLQAVLPLLKEGKEGELRAAVWLLNDLLGRDRGSFASIETYLSEQHTLGKPVDPELVDYIIQRDPVLGMEVMLRVFQVDEERCFAQKQSLLAFKEGTKWVPLRGPREPGEIPQFCAFMLACSESPEWWTRLFAAEVIRQIPEYSNAGIVRALRKDRNRYVRDSIATFEHFQGNARRPQKLRFREWSREANQNSRQ